MSYHHHPDHRFIHHHHHHHHQNSSLVTVNRQSPRCEPCEPSLSAQTGLPQVLQLHGHGARSATATFSQLLYHIQPLHLCFLGGVFQPTRGQLVFVPSRPHVVRNVIIPWFRDPEFRAVSVEKILQRIAVDPRRTESTGRRSAKPLVPLGS